VGVSGTGITAVCHELRRRGYAALNGDRDLRLHATREDLPATGILIDATGPLPGIVDDILSRIHLNRDARRPGVDR